MTSRRRWWQEDAACQDRPGLPWTADSDDPGRKAATATMAAICASCPVSAACAATAEAIEASAGFWAGRWRAAHGTRWLPTPSNYAITRARRHQQARPEQAA